MPLETPLANDPTARTPSGEIINQLPKPGETTTLTPDLKTEPEAKPEGETKVEGGAKPGSTLLTKPEEGEGDKKPDAPVGAPEKYEPFKAPEGVKLNEDTIATVSATFKEMNLDQAQSQKLIDLYIGEAQKAVQAAQEGPIKFWEDKRKDWVARAHADKDIGAPNTEQYKTVRSDIAKAINTLDPKDAAEFREVMDLTGVGDNPVFIKAFHKWTKSIVEGSHVTGGGPSKFGQAAPGARPASAASAIYPNLPSGR